MSEAKEKDYVLAQLANNLSPHEVSGMSKYADTLENDGNIKIVASENGFIIRALLTDKGARFLENGGYKRLYRKRLKQKFWYGFGSLWEWRLPK